jgi:hypothetical protein
MKAWSRFLLVPFLFIAADVVAQRCRDISEVDFRNEVVEPQSAPGVLDQQFRFRNGVFNKQSGGAIEWRFQVSGDLAVHPDPYTTIRFIQISGDHLSGFGTRNYVMGFQCANGYVKNVFQRMSQGSQGLTLVSVSSEIVHLRAPIWKSSNGYLRHFAH